MTQLRHKSGECLDQSLVFLYTYPKRAQLLKSWDSSNGSCRFKSGPGHQSLSKQALISTYVEFLKCLKKRQKEPIGVPSDTTVTQKNHLKINQNSKPIRGDLIMKWFKHFTDNHRGRAVRLGFKEFGWAAYAIYPIIEMCAEKLEKFNDRDLSESDCVFAFERSWICSAVSLKPFTVRSVLTHYQLAGWLAFSESDLEIEIKMPMLLDLLESDQKRSRLRRVQAARSSRLEQNRIEESRIELEQRGKVVTKTARKPSATAPAGANFVVAAYFEAFNRRYGAAPARAPKAIGQLGKLANDFGKDRAIALVEAYLEMPDSWYLTKRHDVGTLVENLNAVSQYLDTGRMITRKDIQNMASSQDLAGQLAAIDRGEQ